MQDSCKILLPDGRNVELCSQGGSDSFLQFVHPFNWFSKNFGEATKIRRISRQRAGGRLPPDVKRQLTYIGFTADSIIKYSTPELFDKKVQKKEIVVWLDYVIAELEFLRTDMRWQLKGALEQHDAFTINPCVYMFTHEAATKLAFEKGFFHVLGKFIAACKAPLLPSPDVAEALCLLITNAIVSVSLYGMNPWPFEKVFKKLEGDGLLVQYIRVSSIPQSGDSIDFPIGILQVYEELSRCTFFLKKRFKAGEPCGDVVHAILNGTDGYKKKRIQVIRKLVAIASYAQLLQAPPGSDPGAKPFKVCRKCSKADKSEKYQSSLMVCSRCQTVFYCSKECQRADWKAHRKQCDEASKSATKRSDTYQQVVFNFARTYHVCIVKKMIEFCDETGLDKSEVLVELDFLANDINGIAPALRNPPHFVVKEARGYFDGTRPNEPDWFYKNEDEEVYTTNINAVMTGLRDHYNRMTPNHILCFVRLPEYTPCFRVQLMVQGGSDTQVFGEEAFNAFRSAMHDGDFDPLSQIFDEAHVANIKEYLIHDEAEMDGSFVGMLWDGLRANLPKYSW